MRYFSFIACICVQLTWCCVHAQNDLRRVTVSGTLKDAKNGEDLSGAQILIRELPKVGGIANEYGFYSISVPVGTYTIVFRFIGYESHERTIELYENQRVNVELLPINSTMNLSEVVVMAEKENDNITKSGTAVTTLNVKDIEIVPVLFGERDVLKTLQLTPGVKSAGEGMSGFYVRGGASDQNLMLIDGAPVYNASHLLGFFSIFNSDALKEVSLYKSGIPAEYGGRASSVMDVRMKEGNAKQLGVMGGIGLIASRVSVEGPIVKDKGAFIISGRRTYVDVFLLMSQDADTRKSSMFFYDLNLKANYNLSPKNRLFVSGYLGRDKFGFSDMFAINWGNATGTIRWNSIISDKLFSNTSLIASNFDYGYQIGLDQVSFGLKAGIRDLNFKQDFNYYLGGQHAIKFGANAIHHTFRPGKLIATTGSFNDRILDDQYAIELGIYVQNDQKIGERFSMMYGLRYASFNYLGEGTAYRFDEMGTKLSETKYKQGESIQYYHFLEPRISASYILSEIHSVKMAYNRNSQFLHQLSNSTTSSPTDIWVPSTNNVKPQLTDQITAGYYRNFRNNMLSLTTEIYYKHLSNQIDFRNGANLFLNAELENGLIYGKGRAYGVELQIEKKKGHLTGWISYTLARSLRTFQQINQGTEFSSRQDRIHDIAVVAMYRNPKKRSAYSISYVYYTGDAVTFPSGKYQINGVQIPYYTERNGYRMPTYHRLDVGWTFYIKERPKLDQSINISVYNVYARENAYMIFFQEDADQSGKTKAMQLSLFRFIPSFTYNFNLK